MTTEKEQEFIVLKRKLDLLFGVLHPNKTWHISHYNYGIGVESHLHQYYDWYLLDSSKKDFRNELMNQALDIAIMREVLVMVQREIAKKTREFLGALHESYM